MPAKLSRRGLSVKLSRRLLNPRPRYEHPSLAEVYKLSQSDPPDEPDSDESAKVVADAKSRRLQSKLRRPSRRRQASITQDHDRVPKAEPDQADVELDDVELDDDELYDAEFYNDDLDDDDLNYTIDFGYYEKGIISRVTMLERWGARFVKDCEETTSAASLAEQGEAESRAPTNEVPSRCEPRESGTASDVASIGSPSLLNWAKRRGMIAVPADFVRITRNAEQAVLLAQLCFWFDFGKEGRQRANFRRFGRIWEPKTHAQWSKETGIPVSRVKTAIQGLCELGFTERKYARVRGARTTLLRPIPPAIAKACGFQGRKSGQCEID